MKEKTVFVCTECGNTVSRWAGKCPACGEWNTLEEQTVAPEPQQPYTTLRPCF